MTKADDPAFPTAYGQNHGMSLRAYAATEAMGAIIDATYNAGPASAAVEKVASSRGTSISAVVGQMAVEFADALIEALAK